MPQFEVATYASQIFWLLVCFIFLCAVMAHYLVPRLTTILEAREQRLQEDWNQANVLGSQEESLRKQNLERLTSARGKTHVLMHQALREAHHNKSVRMAALDEELVVKTKAIRQALEAKTQKILNNIEPLVSQVVMATAPRILGQNLSHAEVKEIAESIFTERKHT